MHITGSPRVRSDCVNSIAEAAAQAFALVLAADPNLVDIVVLSLQVCLASVTMACVLGLPLGAAVAVNEFPGQTACGRRPQCTDGPAAGCRRAVRLSDVVARRPAGRFWNPVHADRDGDRADHPHRTADGRVVAAGGCRRMASNIRNSCARSAKPGSVPPRRCSGTCASRWLPW